MKIIPTIPTPSLLRALALTLVLMVTSMALHAQVPQILNYQGRVAVGDPPVNFDGSGLFKFALVNGNGTQTYWSNDGTSNAGSQPAAAVTLTVAKGLYSVLLGDTSVTNMTALPVSVFNNDDVRLRIWFDDGSNGSQLLTPDHRLAAVGYAIMARDVADGAITSAKIAAGAVGSSHLSNNLSLPGTTTGTFSGSGAGLTNVPFTISNGSVTGTMLAGELTLAGTTTGTFSGSGAGLTFLNGSQVLSGTIADARLSSNVVLLDATQTLTNKNITGIFIGPLMGNAATATTAATVSGDGIAISGGNLSLPLTTSVTGIIRSGSNTLLHSFGTNNLFVGINAGNLTMTGQSNTASGMATLQFNTTGSDNTATGDNALQLNTTGHSNTATGRQALRTNTTGDSNTAVGLQALFSNTEGIGNTGVGRGALYSNTTGINNTATGRGALFTNTLGYENTATGRGALYFNSTGVSNTAMGHLALHTNTTGNWNTASGHQALFSNTTGTSNSAFGLQALFSNTEGSNNTGIGRGALYFNSTGINNTAIGQSALLSNTTGVSNSANGRETLRSNTTGNWNTASGHQSLYSNTTGHSNSAVGLQALFSNTEGISNTGIGRGALYQNTSGSNNIAIGHQAGQNLTTGSNNIVIGSPGEAGQSGTIRIGNADQNRSFMAGIRGVTTGLSDAMPVVIDSNGQLGTGGGAVDTDPANEIQTLSLIGNQISLSPGGGTISLSDNNATNELQTISLVGSTVTLSDGGGSLSINDADADPNNEIQILTLTGNSLQLSREGGEIDLEGRITSSMLADGAVTFGKIADGAVSGDVIADGGITVAKLSGGIPKLVQKTNRPFNVFAVHHNFNATNGGSESGGFLPHGFSGPTSGSSTARLVLREKLPDDLQDLVEIVAQIELSSGGCLGYVRLIRVNGLGAWETVTEVSKNTSGVHTITIQGLALDLESFQYFIEIELRSPAGAGLVKVNWCKISYNGIGI